MWCSAADTHLELQDRVARGARFLTGVCLSVTLLIVDLWQYCVCCIRSGVTRCALFMVLYLCRMCQCRLHAVLWSHIGTLMRRLDAEPCIRLCGTGGFQKQGQCFFIGLSCFFPFCLLLFSPFSYFCILVTNGRYCGPGVF